MCDDATDVRGLRPRASQRFILLLVVLAAGSVLAACDTSCSTIDYTMPPTDTVLGDADAVVRARVQGFPHVEKTVLDAELDVTEVLFQKADGAFNPLTEGTLLVGAYDDPCSRRSGLRFADDKEVLVVLRWIGTDATWDSPWWAFPVLSENPDGKVTFLDTGYLLNERVDELLGEPTVERLIAAVTDTN